MAKHKLQIQEQQHTVALKNHTLLKSRFLKIVSVNVNEELRNVYTTTHFLQIRLPQYY